MLNLGQVALVEERQLQRTALHQGLNLNILERRDPLQALLWLEVVADARRGEHAAIADQNDLLQAETLPKFWDFRRNGLGIPGVAREVLHGDGSALLVGQ